MSWLRRAAEVLHLRPPRPDDERASKGALLTEVKRDSDRAHKKADRAVARVLRAIADEYADVRVPR